MPYISQDDRNDLDKIIDDTILVLEHSISSKISINKDLNDIEFMCLLGRLNYIFSSIIGEISKPINYNKIAMITGVLENIKQEFYRRVASSYEDKKITQNGDIEAYKNL